jgi:hypothetical protein
MRQIIGELIRQEEQSEKGQQQANPPPPPPQEPPRPVKPDSSIVIQQWMDRFEKTCSIPSLAVDDDDDTFLCNANDYNKVHSYDDTLYDDDEKPDEQIPEQPQTAPSPTAALQGITVHFDTTDTTRGVGYYAKLVGFTMIYSDGLEIQEIKSGCDLRGTKQIHLQ